MTVEISHLFLERRNIKVYSAIPHFIESSGASLNSNYGDGVEITRIEGQGNGGFSLELSNETIDEIFSSSEHRSLNPTYKQGFGPVQITVVDPMKIPSGQYTLKLLDPIIELSKIASYGGWELIDNLTGSIISSASEDIQIGSEKYIETLGLDVKISQTENPGTDPTNIENNGLISGTIEFDNINDRWLSGVADRDMIIHFLVFGVLIGSGLDLMKMKMTHY